MAGSDLARMHADFAYQCVVDPVFFAEEVLGWHPWQIQKEILYSIRDNDRTLVQACHASGKTGVASVAVLWFLCTRVPSVVFTTAPTGRQVEKVLWKEIATRFHNSKIKLPGRLLKTPNLKVSHDHFAFGFATDTADSFQGLHAEHIFGVFDEASGVAEEIWEASEGNLSTGYTRFLGIGNPLDPATAFYRACHTDPRANPYVISAYHTPNFTDWDITEEDIFSGAWTEKFQSGAQYEHFLCHPKFAEGIYHQYGERHAAYIARVRGEFPLNADNALIPYGKIMEAIERWDRDPAKAEVRPDLNDCTIGVDVADEGDDLSARATQSGGYVWEIEVHSGADPVETGDIVATDMRKRAVTVAKVDSIGVGSGTVAALRRLGINVVPVNVGHRSRYPKRFRNQKAEGWWHLRQRFMDGTIAIPNDRLLIQELANIRVEYPEAGVIQIEAKKKLKERIGRSPDRADALMLAFFPRGGYGIADASSTIIDPRQEFEEAARREATEITEANVNRFLKAIRNATWR